MTSVRPEFRPRAVATNAPGLAATAPRWMTWVLRAAGVYNVLWGSVVILAPSWSFGWSGLSKPDQPLYYPELWQCIGMIVGVYGVGYYLAARAPLTHWPVVLVGFLGKIFGPVGYLYGVIIGRTPPELIVTNFFNDLIWLVPFALILRAAYRAATPASEPSPVPQEAAGV